MYHPLSFDRNKRMRAGQRQRVDCELVALGFPCKFLTCMSAVEKL
jgi:hypothetical protein